MMVWDESFGQVFIGPVVAVLCICWFLLWLQWHMRSNILELDDGSPEKPITLLGLALTGEDTRSRATTARATVAQTKAVQPWRSVIYGGRADKSVAFGGQRSRSVFSGGRKTGIGRMKSIFFGVDKEDSAGNVESSEEEEGGESSRGLPPPEYDTDKFIMDRFGRMVPNPNFGLPKSRGGTIFGGKSMMFAEKSLGPQLTAATTHKSTFGQMASRQRSVFGNENSGRSVFGDPFSGGFSMERDSQRSSAGNDEDTAGLNCYQEKLKRRRIYCLMGAISGFILLLSSVVSSSDPAEELLMSFSSFHQAIFAMALGHWINVIWEDFRCRQFLVQVMSRDHWLSITSCLALQLFYFVHAAVSLFTFGFILATRTLGGLGVQCLLFEAPTMLLTQRELSIVQVPIPEWLCEEFSLRKAWRLTSWMFLLARGPGTLLWICTWIPGLGADLLQRSVGPTERAVFHVLATFHTLFHLVHIGFMLNWSREDAERAEDMAAELLCQSLAENTKRNSDSEKQGIWDSKPRDSDEKTLGWTHSETMKSSDSIVSEPPKAVRLAALQESSLPANKSALRPASSNSSRGRKTHFQEAPSNFTPPSSQKAGKTISISSAWENDSSEALDG